MTQIGREMELEFNSPTMKLINVMEFCHSSRIIILALMSLLRSLKLFEKSLYIYPWDTGQADDILNVLVAHKIKDERTF